MKTKLKAFAGILFGLALVVAALVLATGGSASPWLWRVMLPSGYLIYLWRCAALAKAAGADAKSGIFFGLFLPPVLLLLLLPGKTSILKAEREMEADRAYTQRELKKGLGCGSLLVIGSVLILGGTELYRARVTVPESKALTTSTEIRAEQLEAGNDGKLVHVVGTLSGTEQLSDREFGVAVEGLRLRRRVWSYQEERGRSSHKGFFGNTYDSKQVWKEDSARLTSQGPAITGCTTTAANIRLGAFSLAPQLLEQLDYHPVPLSETNISALPGSVRAQAKLTGNEIYFGADPKRPEIGDAKVSFEVAPAATVSVIAQQTGTNLLPYRLPKAGSVALLRGGTHSGSEMAARFAQDASSERVFIWAVAGGIMAIGSLIIFLSRRQLHKKRKTSRRQVQHARAA